MTPLGFLTLAGLGYGAYYVATHRKPTPVDGTCPEGWHYMSDGTCMRNEDMPGGTYTPGAAAINPAGWDEMVATYQAIIYGHGSALDCQRLLAYIDRLEPENAAEREWIAARRAEVVNACKAGPVSVESPPPLPAWIPDALASQFNSCWLYLNCSISDFNSLTGQLTNIIQNYAGMVPASQTQETYNAISSLTDRYVQNGIAVAGLGIAPHVGSCGCESCQAAAGAEEEEPCCEACARGVGACACSRSKEEEAYQPTVRGV